MAVYWHPFLAELLRQAYGDRLIIEEEVPLGDMPLKADLLLIRRDPTVALLFPFWFLGEWTLVEYKDPDDAAEQEDPVKLEVLIMTRLTLELPESLLQRLQAEAQKHRCRVEEWVVAQLKEVVMAPEEMTMEERYDRFERECGLYIEFSEEEKQRHCPLPPEELDALSKKFTIGRPLSEIIIEERGRR